MATDRLAGITVTLMCRDPSGSPERPWAVSVSSEPLVLAANGQVLDLTEVRGTIYCPDRAVAEEIARRLTKRRAPMGEPVPVIADERDQFWAAMHRMRDAFLQVKDQLDERAGFMSAPEANGAFFDGYRDVKRLFGTVLLQRDIHAGKDGTDDA